MNTGQDLNREETETFVDAPREIIAPPHTWDDLSIPQLYSTKSQLQDKLWSFHNNAPIAASLKQALVRIDAVIASKT